MKKNANQFKTIKKKINSMINIYQTKYYNPT